MAGQSVITRASRYNAVCSFKGSIPVGTGRTVWANMATGNRPYIPTPRRVDVVAAADANIDVRIIGARQAPSSSSLYNRTDKSGNQRPAWLFQEEVVSLGTAGTAATSTKTWIRIFSMELIVPAPWGTAGDPTVTSTGNIDITEVGVPATIYDRIPSGSSHSHFIGISGLDDRDVEILGFRFSNIALANFEHIFREKPAEQTNFLELVNQYSSLGSGAFVNPLKLEPGHDFEMATTATSLVASAGISLTIRMKPI